MPRTIENSGLERNLRVEMRDGVDLACDLYRPAVGGPRFPALLYRTPYGKAAEVEEHLPVFKEGIRRGYAMLACDVRGRFDSDGEFVPYFNEGKDGYDTIEWAARQSWSDGNVGMWGVSYPGASQLLAAMERPPHLRSIIPSMVYTSPQNFFYYGENFPLDWIEWLYKLIAPDVRQKRKLAGPKTEKAAEDEWQLRGPNTFYEPLPLTAMSHLREVAPYYYQWIETDPRDAYWDPIDIEAHIDSIRVPTFLLGGWYDSACGVRAVRVLFQKLPGPKQLLLGPWRHGGTQPERTRAGVRDFGVGAAVDYPKEIFDWSDRYVRRHRLPPVAAARVFLPGSNRWIHSEQWPRVQSQRIALNASAGTAHFRSDPKNPVTDRWGAESGAQEVTELRNHPGVLFFQSRVLRQDLNVLGGVKLILTARSALPSFDIKALVVDVQPNGQLLTVTAGSQGIRRGRSGVFVLEDLAVGNTFKRGHRLGLLIMGHWYPTLSRNLQTGRHERESADTRAGDIYIERVDLRAEVR